MFFLIAIEIQNHSACVLAGDCKIKVSVHADILFKRRIEQISESHFEQNHSFEFNFVVSEDAYVIFLSTSEDAVAIKFKTNELTFLLYFCNIF